MKRILFTIFVLSLFFSSTHFSYSGTFVVMVDQENESAGSVDVNRSYYGAPSDIIMHGQDQMHPFAFTSSPLGHALRLSSRLLGELCATHDDQLIKDEILRDMNGFCDLALDLSTLCDVAILYVRNQIAVMPEKQNYFCEEVNHFRQKVIMLTEQFLHLIEGQEFLPEIITTCVVFDRIVKKTGELISH